MRDRSVKGIYRRYVVEPAIAILGTSDPAIVGDPSKLWVKKDLMAPGTTSLAACLQTLAQKGVGPADWYQEVCDNIVGRVACVQTWTHIDVRISLVPDAGVSSSTLQSLMNTWKVGIEAAWNAPVKVPGGAPAPWRCSRTGEVPCRVSVLVQWVSANAHHTVFVHPGAGATNEKHWYTSDPGALAAHEFGHMLGLPDEYPDPVKCPDRSPVSTGTIMDNNSTFIPQRLVQWIANEIGSTLQ